MDAGADEDALEVQGTHRLTTQSARPLASRSSVLFVPSRWKNASASPLRARRTTSGLCASSKPQRSQSDLNTTVSPAWSSSIELAFLSVVAVEHESILLMMKSPPIRTTHATALNIDTRTSGLP